MSGNESGSFGRNSIYILHTYNSGSIADINNYYINWRDASNKITDGTHTTISIYNDKVFWNVGSVTQTGWIIGIYGKSKTTSPARKRQLK